MEENRKEQSPTNLQIAECIKLHKEASDNFAHTLKLNPKFAQLYLGSILRYAQNYPKPLYVILYTLLSVN